MYSPENYQDPWGTPEQITVPPMTPYQVTRTSLRFCAIAGTSFSVAVTAQSVPPSISWTLLGVGAMAWAAAVGAAILKKGDDSWAMVGVTCFGILGTLVGIGELLASLSIAQIATPILAILTVLLFLVGIERLISQKSRGTQNEPY